MKKNNSLRLDLLEIADYASVTWDNKLNIFGIFDQIVVSGIPTNHGRLFVVGIVVGQPRSTYNLRVLITDPDGKELMVQPLNVTTGNNGRSNIIAEVGGLPIKSLGRYKFEIDEGIRSLGDKVLEISTKYVKDGQQKANRNHFSN